MIENPEEKLSKTKVEKFVKPNIFAKLLAISSEIKTVAKNLEVSMGGGKYKAVGELDVLNAVKPLEHKHGVYSYPVSREIVESGTLESVDSRGNTKRQLFERIKTTYRFVNIDCPSEYIEIVSYGDGIDSGDKSVGKAMTYADKYALLKAYKVMTGDDPDQDASDDLKETNIKNELDPTLLARCSELGIDINKGAAYLKKDVSALTNDNLKAWIEQKENAIKNRKAKND